MRVVRPWRKTLFRNMAGDGYSPGFAPQFVTLASFDCHIAADLRPMELYPEWGQTMAEWDSVHGQLTETECRGYSLRHCLSRANSELRGLETQIASINGYGLAGEGQAHYCGR